MEKCLSCNDDFPVTELRSHIQKCQRYTVFCFNEDLLMLDMRTLFIVWF